MPSTLTTRHHTSQALRFKNAAGIYMAIGRTTAWSNEASPPAPSASATAVEEVVCYAPPAQITLVKPDAGGAIEHLGTYYTAVSDGNAYTEGAYLVYVKCEFPYTQAPLCTFRQVGLYLGLVKNQGAGSGVLLPADVSSPGILEAIDNRTPTVRAADKKDVEAMLLSF